MIILIWRGKVVMKKIGTVIVSVILWVIILVAALYSFTTMATRDNQNVSSILGYTPLVVKSDSMAPTFNAGDMIFIRKCDPSTLKEGDIICFHTIIDNEYALNTHRIKEISDVGAGRSYTTIGDNNNGVVDQHIISDGDIVGKYIGHLSKVGKVMDFISSSTGFLLVIVFPMLLFFIYQVYNLIMINIKLKKAIAIENAKEIEEAKAASTAAGKAADDEAASKLAEAKRIMEEAEAMKRQAMEEIEKAKNAENRGEEDK